MSLDILNAYDLFKNLTLKKFLTLACVPAALKPPSNLRYPRLADDLKLPVRYRSAMQRLMRESDKWWGEEENVREGCERTRRRKYQFIAKGLPGKAAKPNLAAVNIDQLPEPIDVYTVHLRSHFFLQWLQNEILSFSLFFWIFVSAPKNLALFLDIFYRLSL